jgi:hypothetical protein
MTAMVWVDPPDRVAPGGFIHLSNVAKRELVAMSDVDQANVLTALNLLLDGDRGRALANRVGLLRDFPDSSVDEVLALRIAPHLEAVVYVDLGDETEPTPLRPTRYLVSQFYVSQDRMDGLSTADAEEQPAPDPSERSPARAARATTGLAARMAGPQRAYLRDDWAAILAGSPEDGVTFSPRRQFQLALGFLRAAVRMRWHDLARPLWRPVDWILRTESRTNGFIATMIGAQAIYIVGDDGLPALVTEVWEPCGIAGAALFVLARWLRRVRGIELSNSTSTGEE